METFLEKALAVGFTKEQAEFLKKELQVSSMGLTGFLP